MENSLNSLRKRQETISPLEQRVADLEDRLLSLEMVVAELLPSRLGLFRKLWRALWK